MICIISCIGFVEGNDYLAVSEVVIFGSILPQVQCRNVSIVSDGILEDMEVFFLELTSSNQRVLVGPRAMVTIVDNDSKIYTLCTWYAYSLVSLKTSISISLLKYTC